MELYSPARDLHITSINSALLRHADEDFYFDGEMHDFWELIYATSGSITVSEDDRIYTLSKGQAIFHKPMEFHRLHSKKGSHAELIIISFTAEGDLLAPLSGGVFELDLYLSEMLLHTYEQIENAFDCSDIPIRPAAKDGIEESLAFVNLELFLLSVLSKISPSKEQTYSVGARNYKKIISVMNNHLDENLSVSEIAALCCLGVSNLKKTFRTYAGCGIMQHYTRLRILRAASYLKSGMRVTEIAKRMSFSSPAYFSAVFKRETGVSPKNFK